MAFNPSAYKAPSAKKLPVILLLDVSGSMSGAKIETLYDSVNDMVESFVAAQVKETIIDVSIITFGASVELHTPYTSVTELKDNAIERFEASGMTPLGTALTMAKDMIEDKDVTPSKIYRPAVVIVSDGQPNDEWKAPMERFINDGRSSKCQRFAIAIGEDADKAVLQQFTGEEANVFVADNASDITDCFQKFTMSVSTRATSQNPNAVPSVNVNTSSDEVTSESVDGVESYDTGDDYI